MYNDLLVIARPGDSIWAPVPVERFARTLAVELKSGADDAERTRNRAKTWSRSSLKTKPPSGAR